MNNPNTTIDTGSYHSLLRSSPAVGRSLDRTGRGQGERGEFLGADGEVPNRVGQEIGDEIIRVFGDLVLPHR